MSPLYVHYFVSLLATGDSPLADMPNASELASLGLPLAPLQGGEDPLTAVAGSAFSSSRGDPCKLTSSGPTHSISAVHPGGSPNPVRPVGFSQGNGFPLITPKLVAKILKRAYVSMAELLPDNLKLAHCSAEAQRSASCSSKAPKKSEVWKGLVAWSVCFSTLVATVSKEHPEKFRELLAYHTTILIKALRFECKGWLCYDKMFSEHIEKGPNFS